MKQYKVMPIESLFCIEHEDMFAVVETPVGIGHEHSLQFHNGIDVEWEFDFCEFPLGWATCAPPEFDIDHFAQTAEPYQEDLVSAADLMADVGLL